MMFARETYSQVIDEIKVLTKLHYDEAAVFDFEFNPQFQVYELMEQAKMLHIFTAREDGALVGYVVSFITKHIHYEHVDVCMCDLIFLHPDYRKGWTASNMLQGWTEDIKLLGVNMACVPTRNKALIKTLSHQKFSEMDVVMARKL